MKFVIVFAALFAIALAAPAKPDEAYIVNQDSDVDAEGYKFGVETSDGKIHQEEGHLVNVGSENEALVVKGSYQYVGDDGVLYSVQYIADENGFQPQGAHLPVV